MRRFPCVLLSVHASTSRCAPRQVLKFHQETLFLYQNEDLSFHAWTHMRALARKGREKTSRMWLLFSGTFCVHPTKAALTTFKRENF